MTREHARESRTFGGVRVRPRARARGMLRKSRTKICECCEHARGPPVRSHSSPDDPDDLLYTRDPPRSNLSLGSRAFPTYISLASNTTHLRPPFPWTPPSPPSTRPSALCSSSPPSAAGATPARASPNPRVGRARARSSAAEAPPTVDRAAPQKPARRSSKTSNPKRAYALVRVRARARARVNARARSSSLPRRVQTTRPSETTKPALLLPPKPALLRPPKPALIRPPRRALDANAPLSPAGTTRRVRVRRVRVRRA